MINTFPSETWNEALSELRAAMVAVLPPNRRKLPNLEVRSSTASDSVFTDCFSVTFV
ncbi:hypothetical protein LEP1GSC151_2303 [Leptospira interrogans serovar Grippotyphosa str. LT2186]|uniref:Uncharacterized protein n=1 Tax=Leptospira interrogans serovar Grippotyphosa str. LT2186 TaxID=1001599 RepID=M3I2Z4_LEPIR|nr:hypothetical protein LEP1GSC151_2303 [Leptospira interrogans serovar Grippotyphosa str. LT2186]